MLLERVIQQRNEYQLLLRNRVRALRSSQSRFASELLIEPNNHQSSRPFSLIRVDAIYGPIEAPTMERIVSERAVPTELQRYTLDCGICVSGGPISWESSCFAFQSPDFHLNLLSSWLNEWIDLEEVKEQDGDGLSGVVHSCTGIEGDSFHWQLLTDFGSAPMAAFDELLALLARNGVRDCTLSVPDDS
jgi:hypothetical protein